jgi:hypothetical protein
VEKVNCIPGILYLFLLKSASHPIENENQAPHRRFSRKKAWTVSASL